MHSATLLGRNLRLGLHRAYLIQRRPRPFTTPCRHSTTSTPPPVLALTIHTHLLRRSLNMLPIKARQRTSPFPTPSHTSTHASLRRRHPQLRPNIRVQPQVTAYAVGRPPLAVPRACRAEDLRGRSASLRCRSGCWRWRRASGAV